jgi:hypothetical protein
MGGFLTKPVDQLSPAIVKQSRSIFTPHLTDNIFRMMQTHRSAAKRRLKMICVSDLSVEQKNLLQ